MPRQPSSDPTPSPVIPHDLARGRTAAAGIDAPIVVTGASGFIGRHLVQRLLAAGCAVRAVSRTPAAASDTDTAPATPANAPALHRVASPSADATVDEWREVVSGALAVVHLAGLAHRPLDADANDRATRRAALRELRRVNVVAAHRLARAAQAAGVRDFIFVSSIKAIAERSDGSALDESTPPRPEDCYGLAKLAAERKLARIASRRGDGPTPPMRICVLRPPLVYGPGVKGNFAQLQRAIDAGWPLPLAGIDNRRSLLHVGNLVDAMMRILARPDAPGGVYHLCDPEPMATPALVASIARAGGRRARLFGCPPALLRAIARATGRDAQFERLSGSLVLDDRAFRKCFDWTPRRSTDEALAADARSPGSHDATGGRAA